VEQTVLADSITKHLDALLALVNYAILLALAVTWTGLQRTDELTVLGIKFSRKHAFFVVSPLYLIMNLALVILFLRIGDLLNLLDNANFSAGLTRLTVHPWLLNPFALFGSTRAARLYQAEGYGLLIVTWWLCNSSLLALTDDLKRHLFTYFVFTSLFLCMGVGAMGAINRIFYIIGVRMALLNPALQGAIKAAHAQRDLESLLGIGIGVLLHMNVLRLQSRSLMRRTATAQ
jgi:hypothetical protein